MQSRAPVSRAVHLVARRAGVTSSPRVVWSTLETRPFWAECSTRGKRSLFAGFGLS